MLRNGRLEILEINEVEFRHGQVMVQGSSIHFVEAGDPQCPPIIFLYGWPESWYSWRAVMALASKDHRAVAIDLPGVGGSTCPATDGSKHQLAEVLHRLIDTMGLHDLTIVGQDVGGMIVHSYLRQHKDVARAVITDVVIPGIDPWDEVLRNPHIWHFALHSVPDLPKKLVQGRQAVYFDYFYDTLRLTPLRSPLRRVRHT